MKYETIKKTIEDEITYKIVVGDEVLSKIPEFLEDINLKYAVVGKGVAESCPWVLKELERFFERVDVLEDGEASKSLETALNVVETLWKLRADRWSAIAVSAGGSLGDTVSFAASIYMRGIFVIQIPTTLLAMIDSSIGGKTAVNWKGYKNIIGSFYHPSLIVDDLRFIDTLPERVYKSSLAEAIKYGITLDKDFLEWLSTNVREILDKARGELIKLIIRSAELKLDVVSKDPRERKGVREVLNFGHTVGHALEATSDYALYHGEAVALGMLVETMYSERKGYCSACTDEVREVLDKYGLIAQALSALGSLPSKDAYVKAIMADKKRRGDAIRLPVLRGIGTWELKEVPVQQFAEETYELLKGIAG